MGACCSNDPKNGEADTTLSIVEDGKLSSADNSQRGETISPRTEEGLDSPDDTASSKHTSVEEPSAGHQRVDQLERQNSTISCGSLPSAIPEPIQERRKSMLAAPVLGDGNYLTYEMSNNGCFISTWRKDPAESPLAYARPREGVRIPPFKYKGKSELARGIHKSKKGACDGILQYLRSLKQFQCEFILLDSHGQDTARLPQVILVLHFEDDMMELVEPNMHFVDLNDVDFAAAILINTTGEQDMRAFASQERADLKQFQARCKQNSEHVEFMNLGAREL